METLKGRALEVKEAAENLLLGKLTRTDLQEVARMIVYATRILEAKN